MPPFLLCLTHPKIYVHIYRTIYFCTLYLTSYARIQTLYWSSYLFIAIIQWYSDNKNTLTLIHTPHPSPSVFIENHDVHFAAGNFSSNREPIYWIFRLLNQKGETLYFIFCQYAISYLSPRSHSRHIWYVYTHLFSVPVILKIIHFKTVWRRVYQW